MKKYIMLIVLLLCTTGCVTKGRFSLIDLDLRDKDQIEAYNDEAQMVYIDNYNVSTNEIQAKGIESLPWYADVLKVIKARIRVVSFEWFNE